MGNQYIYQNQNWPNFVWDKEKILQLLSEVKQNKGLLLGKMSSIGLLLQENANLTIITEDIVKSSEIEGEKLNVQAVRSSVARKLGIDIENSVSVRRNIDGIVSVMIDATHNYNSKLTKERLFGWHNAMFSSGYSDIVKIRVGSFRDDANGRMRVVSGYLGKEIVHYEAPEAKYLDKEMVSFLNWVNNDSADDLIIKAAIAHLWFVTLHPFDDGNGRIGRVIMDMFLTRADKMDKRFYSMSSQIQKTKIDYYNILEKTQKGSLDITLWLDCFLRCLLGAVRSSEEILSAVLAKYTFLQKITEIKLNVRQRKIIDLLFDNFKGNLTSSKWAKITKISQDTASRDIDELVKYKLLSKKGSGRSTHYALILNK